LKHFWRFIGDATNKIPIKVNVAKVHEDGNLYSYDQIKVMIKLKIGLIYLFNLSE